MAPATDADAWGTERWSWHCHGCGHVDYHITDKQTATHRMDAHAEACPNADTELSEHPL